MTFVLLRPRLAPYAFFLLLLLFVGAVMAFAFSSEFPALTLLCKWDCGWYESIARQGYLSPIPPLFQDSEHSNVAFFPAYPLLGRFVAWLFSISLQSALPLTSILCSILVSIAIARLVRNETRDSTFTRYAILLAYPATFYLTVAYSEALYLAALLGGSALLLKQDTAKTTAKSRFLTPTLLFIAGFVLGGTRLTGFVIPAFLFLGVFLFNLGREKLTPGFLIRSLRAPYLIGAVLGIGSFLTYCALHFGVWNLYFQQLAIGWYKEFSPLKALKILLTAPFPPSLNQALLLSESRRLSWMVITTLVTVGAYAGVRAALSARDAYREKNRDLFLRCFLVFGSLAHLFIVVCGDVGPWDIWGNGLRYPMPTAYLLALMWQDEWTPAWIRKNPLGKYLAFVALGTILAFLYSLQVGYLVRFIRNEWVS